MKNWFLLAALCCASLLVQAEPLPANEVFKIGVKKTDPNTLVVHWDIKSGYFLYRKRISINEQTDSNIHLGTLRFPPSLTQTDKQGHSYPVYRKQVNLPVGILGEKAGETLLTVHYQGCSDDGFCYPPESKPIRVTIDPQLAISEVNLEADSTVVDAPSDTSPSKDLSLIFTEHHWPMTLLIFFGLGLLLSFTPCILPMIPVLSGIIVGHGKEVTTKKAFFLSLSYVLSMSLTYAIVGAVVALLGANIQVNMQSPWAISIFSIIFILLALSMFGFYEFKLPESWQAKIAGSSRNQRGGHYLGAAIMGCLSTLILSPCVTAPLIGVLTYISQTQNVLLGSLTLFFLSLGMGTPLLLIGTSAGKWLPESGQWMNAIKSFFGVMLLAVALYLMGRIIPPAVNMGLWASLFIFSGVYSGALSPCLTATEKFWQSVGIILLSYGLLILVGMSKGSTNPLFPLLSVHAESLANSSFKAQKMTLEEVNQAIVEADGKPVMLDFYADWCASCKVMDATTFQDPQVLAALSRFKVIKIDVTKNDSNNKNLMRHFNVIAPPTFLFFDNQGRALSGLTQVGELAAPEFLSTLNQVQL